MGPINNPALTVGELQALGMDSVEASCCLCETRWLAPVDFLPSGTTLAKIAELMICSNCGNTGIHISLALATNPFK